MKTSIGVTVKRVLVGKSLFFIKRMFKKHTKPSYKVVKVLIHDFFFVEDKTFTDFAFLCSMKFKFLIYEQRRY